MMATGIGWLGGSDRGKQRQQLPDGSTMELIGTTFGDNHRFVTGVRWQKLLWPLGIPELNERLDTIHDLSLTGAVSRSLALWVRHDPPCPFSRHSFEAFDETGATVVAESSAGWGDVGNGVDPVEVLDVSTFPRRGKTVGVRLLLDEVGEIPAPTDVEFRLPNPDPGPHPIWKPSPLPITVKRQGLMFELRRFVTTSSGSIPEGARWTELGFRVTESEPSHDWYPMRVTITDATGNLWTEHSAGRVLRFSGTLDPRETYRLRVEFTCYSKFAAKDRWRLPLLPLPSSGKTRALNLSARREDVRLDLVGLLGRKTRPNPSVGYGPYLHVVHSPNSDAYRVTLLSVVDEAGRNLKKDAPLIFSSGNGHLYFSFKDHPTTRALKATLAVRPIRIAEFLARPTAVQGGGS